MTFKRKYVRPTLVSVHN